MFPPPFGHSNVAVSIGDCHALATPRAEECDARARSVNRKLLRRTCHRRAVAVHSHHAIGSTAGACNGIATRATTRSGRDRSAAERTKSVWLCNRR